MLFAYDLNSYEGRQYQTSYYELDYNRTLYNIRVGKRADTKIDKLVINLRTTRV